jgi:hypothetical protein
MGLHGPSRTQIRWDRVGMGSTRPVRRSTSCGHSTNAPALRRSFGRPSLDLRSPTELITGNPCRPAGFPAGRTTLPLVDFCCPTTQCQAGGYVSRQRIHPPPRRHVRGLATPFAAITSGPPDACAPERPWASPFKVFPSSQAVPLSGSIPSCRYPLPRGVAGHKAQTTPLGNAAGFRALFLRRIRSVTGITNDSSRRYLLGFRPSRVCSYTTWRSL